MSIDEAEERGLVCSSRTAAFGAKRTFGERSLNPLLRAKRSLPNAGHKAPLSSGPRLSRAQTGPPQPCPRLQLPKWTNPSFVRGEGSTVFTSTLRGLLADRNLALASCYVSIAAMSHFQEKLWNQVSREGLVPNGI
jgi:hypothetical protein